MAESAGSDLATLLATLRTDDPQARERATAEIWERWFDEKGTNARRHLEHGTTLLSVDRIGEALVVFERLVASHSDFAEAHNKKATALYLMRRFPEAREACHETLRLNPVHFGAWHGLGLCEMELGHYLAAQRAFAQALEIQPHTTRNRDLLDHCRRLVN
jgi:tetratricopeptide (TPR) repeat protein